MTINQSRLYWREWQQCREWYTSHGYTPKDADAKRGELTVLALGYPKSMSNWGIWTNSEVDKVLAKFRAVYDGGNLSAQMEVEDQPMQRRAKLRTRCFEAVAVWIKGSDRGHSTDLRQRYLDALCRRVCGDTLDSLDERSLQKVCGIVERQAKKKSAPETAEPNPF